MPDQNSIRPAILFVCLGNICRSPMAEGALRSAAAKAGLEIRIDSAGTADYHIGSAPDPRAIAAARTNGVDISGLKARQLAAEDFRNFTHIFGLDKANMEGIRARCPNNTMASVAMLLEALPGHDSEPVVDPYHGDDEGFEACWDIVAEAADALVERFMIEGVDARF